MISDIITIDNQGRGFDNALEEAGRVAAYAGLDKKNTTRLSLLTHEMLSLARSITGEMHADFWIEKVEGQFNLHMTTETVMDAEKRDMLINATSSRKNEAARGLVGWLRDKVERMMVAQVDHSEQEEVPYDLMSDVANSVFEEPEWDGYERSVLMKIADNVKIGIRGRVVDILVTKRFDA